MVAIQVPQLEPDDWYEHDDEPRLRLVERQPSRQVRRVPDRATRIRRRRLAALLTLAVAAVFLWIVVQVVVPAVVGTSVGSGDPEPLPASDGAYVVQPGDSLWSIARRMAPDEDPRPIVSELRERYGDAELDPGDRLELDLS